MSQIDCKKFFEKTKTQVKQQELPACQPILNPLSVIIMLVVTGIVYLPIGLVILDFSNRLKQVTHRYDNNPNCAVTNSMNSSTLPKMCQISFTLEVDMPSPIYFYYGLTNYFQNERAYSNSVYFPQLRGQTVDTIDLVNGQGCYPIQIYNKTNVFPCGLLSNTIFTDRFSLSVNNVQLCPECVAPTGNQTWADVWSLWKSNEWSGTNIAWDSDFNTFYQPPAAQTGFTRQAARQVRFGLNLPTTTNEDLMVWNRIAPLSDFRKLHRVIRTRSLRAGDNITVSIANWYSVQQFSGTKTFTLSTGTPFGGKNETLAYLCITIGVASLVCAVFFAVRFQCSGRTISDMSAYQWKHPF